MNEGQPIPVVLPPEGIESLPPNLIGDKGRVALGQDEVDP